MQDMKAHPNTEAVLGAWRRLAQSDGVESGPTTDDYPGLVGSLFVLNHDGEGDFSFRRVGFAIEKLFGRALAEHNFLSLWNEPDRQLVASALALARTDQGPVIVHARGESLDGRKVDVEFGLAPLAGPETGPVRYLGVCQCLTPSEVLGGRPLRRLQSVAVFPPAPVNPNATIRLVSSR